MYVIANFFSAKVFALLQGRYASSLQDPHFGLLSPICSPLFLRPPEFLVLFKIVLVPQFLDVQFVLLGISHLSLLAQATFLS